MSLADEDSLARLKRSNPRHYSIVVRVLAAANEICDASRTGSVPVKFNAQDISCAQGLWLASNPPKRYLQFRIEDTAYSALIVAPHTGARLQPTR